MVDEGVSPLRCGPLLIEDSAVHGSDLLHSGEEVLARDGSFALGRLQAFEQVHLQSDVAQSVLSDERLEGLPVARVTSWPASLSPTPRATKGWTSPRLPMVRIVMFMDDSSLLLMGGFLS